MNDTNHNSLREYLSQTSHVIIKIGTNLITPHIEQNSSIFFEELARQVITIQNLGKKVIIVSSGAVGAGKKSFIEKKGHLPTPLTLIDRQALSSLGQCLLMNTYIKYLSQHNLLVSQVLVSRYDFEHQNHYLNLKNTMEQLLEWGIIPIINENDTVAIEELRLGDNDQLAASITSMYSKSILIILTSVDGFYIQDKKQDYIYEKLLAHYKYSNLNETTLTELITHKTNQDIMSYAGDPSEGGMGGMKTKLLAAHKVVSSGQAMSIALGQDPSILSKIIQGENIGTWFFTHNKELTENQRWLIHKKEEAIIFVHEDFNYKQWNTITNYDIESVILYGEGKELKKDSVVLILTKHFKYNTKIQPLGYPIIAKVKLYGTLKLDTYNPLNITPSRQQGRAIIAENNKEISISEL